MTVDQRTLDPDWDRYLVDARGSGGGSGKVPPVGDPIRWGGTVEIPLVGPFPEGLQEPRAGSTILVRTAPIVNASAKDGYARGWSIVGSLRMPAAAWDPTKGTYPDPELQTVNALIEVVTGVGQVSFVQQILLAAAGKPTLGLCNQQAAANGGPYGQLLASDAASSWITRPFAAIGSIVGTTVSIRGVVMLGDVFAWPSNAYLTIGVAPMAAGEGI